MNTNEMEFNRDIELSKKGMNNISMIHQYIYKEIGLDYEENNCSITIYDINLEEDNALNIWLDENKYQI